MLGLLLLQAPPVDLHPPHSFSVFTLVLLPYYVVHPSDLLLYVLLDEVEAAVRYQIDTYMEEDQDTMLYYLKRYSNGKYSRGRPGLEIVDAVAFVSADEGTSRECCCVLCEEEEHQTGESHGRSLLAWSRTVAFPPLSPFTTSYLT